ncbi:hypothetical protein ACTWP4_18785 [Gracilibacillus sp. D59]|uniref:hypothetical protein n=1 Tax=Gracilibacillus sp. D59 TaxID=3457434 RepID=UPI003FCE5735
MRDLKEPIPHFYITLANEDGHLFKRYVIGYMERTRPDYELIRIIDQGKLALLTKKE